MQPASGITVTARAATPTCYVTMVASYVTTPEKIKLSVTSTRASALAEWHRQSTHQTRDRCITRPKIGSHPRPSVSSRSALFSNCPLLTDSQRLNIRLDRNKKEAWVWPRLREEKLVSNSRIKNCLCLPPFATAWWCVQAKVSASRAETSFQMRLRPCKTATTSLLRD